MKSSLILCGCALFAISAAGCHANSNQVLMEREHRELEDENYQLDDELKQAQAELESCRRENAALKKGGVSIRPGDLSPPPRPSVDAAPIMPKIDLGIPDSPAQRASPADKPPADREPISVPELKSGGDAPPAGIDSQTTRSSGVRPASLSADIEHLSINRWMTGASSFGSKPSNDGLIVVFTPRDSAGQPVEVSGDVSIVVIDPAAEGEAKRVARWDFSALEVLSHYRQSTLVKAARFELVWPDAPPKHDDVKLYVRMTTADGRQFDDNLPLHLKKGVAGDQQAWSKASSPSHEWAPASAPLDPPQSAETTAKLDQQPTQKPEVHDAGGQSSKYDAESADNRRGQPEQSASDTSESASPTPRTAKARPTWSPYR